MIRRGAEGFTLLEVLIAAFVLGIGLLGVAGLQSISLSLNQGSYTRSQATILARDIADRMRANNRGVSNDAYDMGGGASPSETTSCNATAGCNTGAMAANDLYEWRQQVSGTLPAGQAVVCIDATPADGTPGSPACDGAGSDYAIKIWWYSKEEDLDAGRATNELFVTEFRP